MFFFITQTGVFFNLFFPLYLKLKNKIKLGDMGKFDFLKKVFLE
jgi:hypothetical protein